MYAYIELQQHILQILVKQPAAWYVSMGNWLHICELTTFARLYLPNSKVNLDVDQ